MGVDHDYAAECAARWLQLDDPTRNALEARFSNPATWAERIDGRPRVVDGPLGPKAPGESVALRLESIAANPYLLGYHVVASWRGLQRLSAFGVGKAGAEQSLLAVFGSRSREVALGGRLEAADG